jgi:hypothetical protein
VARGLEGPLAAFRDVILTDSTVIVSAPVR